MIRSSCQMDKGERTGEVSGACELLKSVPAVKIFDRLDDVGLLFFGEFGVDREGEHFLGRALGDREGSVLERKTGTGTGSEPIPIPAIQTGAHDTNRCQA